MSACDHDDPKPIPGISNYVEVNTEQLTNITYYSASFETHIPAQNGVTILNRGMVWGNTEYPTLEEKAGIVYNGEGHGNYHSEINDLAYNTQYYARAFVESNYGIAYGNQHQFTTLEDKTVMDVDGNIYQIININGTEWMAQNLMVRHYRNGSSIAADLTDSQWQNTHEGAYSIYPYSDFDDIDIADETAYGFLYNHQAVSNAIGLCPIGWRLPLKNETEQLINFIQQNGGANGLKSCKQENSILGSDCDTNVHPRWDANTMHYGTDDYSFSGLPAGFRNNSGSFEKLGQAAYWWTASELNHDFAWHWSVFNDSDEITLFVREKNNGFAVRCIKE